MSKIFGYLNFYVLSLEIREKTIPWRIMNIIMFKNDPLLRPTLTYVVSSYEFCLHILRLLESGDGVKRKQQNFLI